MARGKFLRNLLGEYHAAKAPQKGFFSTLDELIQQAPFEQAPADQWIGYLKPGRMLDRDGAQFPLKAEELEWSEILDTLKLRGEGEPGLAISKSDLLESVRRTRPSFALTVGDDELMRGFTRTPRPPRSVEPSANTPMQQTTRSELEALADLQQPVGIRRLKIRGAQYGPNDYDDFDLENAQRLSHVSPGSRYQESVTRMQGYNYPQHFDRDALAWSRTSSHQSPHGRVRLIEEIQSDPHQHAAKRVKRSIDNLSPEEKSQLIQLQNEYGGSSQEVSDFWDSLTPGPRRGYITDDRRLREIVREYGRDPNAPIESAQLRADTPLDILNEFESDSRVPDAPFKDAADYGRLELRKQLINAANADEDYLALTNPEDQIARYSLEGKEAENMRRVYGGTYRKEMEKLARVYGAEIEDVEVPLRSVVDYRPQSMIDLDAEIADDVTDLILHGDQSEKDSVRDVIDDLAGHNATTRDRLHTLVDELEELVDAGASESSRANKLNELITEDLEFLLGERARVMTRAAPADEVKTFPAIRLTPEVRERIKRIGVPLWSVVGGVPVVDELTSEGEDEEDEEVDPVQMSRGGALRDALRRLRDRSNRVLDKASSEEHEVVDRWMSEHSDLSPSELETMDRLISRVSTPPGIVVHRGDARRLPIDMSAGEIKEHLENVPVVHDIVTRSQIDMPISTSADPGIARSFARFLSYPGHVSHVIIPEGANALYLDSINVPEVPYEKEVVLPRRMDFEPTSDLRVPPRDNLPEILERIRELRYKKFTADGLTRPENLELQRLVAERERLTLPTERDYIMLRRKALGGPVQMEAGGSVDDARRRERAQQATHEYVEEEPERDHRLLDRMLANLRMQVSSVNEEGDVVPFYRQETPEDFVMEFDASGYPTNLHERPPPEVRMPGVLLDATSLPAVFGLAGEDSVSGEALRKMEIIEQAMREQYDIDEPQGALEHGAEALGMMLGQIPVAPLGVAKGVAGALGRYVPKILKGRAARAATLPLRAGAEFMAPVVEPRASNYALGTAFGAAMGIGSGGEELPTEEPLYEVGEYLLTGEQLVRLARLMEEYDDAE